MFAALFSIIPFFIISTKSYLYYYTLLKFSAHTAHTKKYSLKSELVIKYFVLLQRKNIINYDTSF